MIKDECRYVDNIDTVDRHTIMDKHGSGKTMC